MSDNYPAWEPIIPVKRMTPGALDNLQFQKSPPCNCPPGECHDAGSDGCYFGSAHGRVTLTQWRLELALKPWINKAGSLDVGADELAEFVAEIARAVG